MADCGKIHQREVETEAGRQGEENTTLSLHGFGQKEILEIKGIGANSGDRQVPVSFMGPSWTLD